MSDLSIQNHWHCVTAEAWSTTVEGAKGRTYTVSWNKWGHKRADVEYSYCCTCPGYQFGFGEDCKHITLTKSSGKHCNWMQFRDGGEAISTHAGQFCPQCGLGVRSMGWCV